MISYIKGTLAEKRDAGAVVEASGIGYFIYMSTTSLSGLPAEGKEVKVYTHFSVGQDAMRLYGFLDEEERDMFRMLIRVSGLGPKGALGILSTLSADELRFAILADDEKAISRAPGVGKKIAQKIIVELKDKMDLQEAFDAKSAHVAAAAVTGSATMDDARDEAVQALVALGYGGAAALKAVKASQLPETASAEDWIREALKHM